MSWRGYFLKQLSEKQILSILLLQNIRDEDKYIKPDLIEGLFHNIFGTRRFNIPLVLFNKKEKIISEIDECISILAMEIPDQFCLEYDNKYYLVDQDI